MISDISKQKLNQLSEDVIMQTPVDTGYAIANWNISLNTPDNSITETRDPSGANALSNAKSAIDRYKLGDEIYITNNVPYILQLEDGYSSQSSMMVERAILNFKD